jgi:monoamine oxidase
MSEHHPVIIIGAGLSGLYAAWRLHRQQVNVLILEARPRIGGRILSEKPEGHESAIDLGPAWIWPAFQQRMQALVNELGVPLFSQYTKGDLLYETETGDIHRHGGPSSHDQSFRIVGGKAALVDALRSQLPESSVQTGITVRSIRRDGLQVEAEGADGPALYSADRVILALPPRLLLNNIELNPGPDETMQKVWSNTPTWMAGHEKRVFIYEEPFWRRQGLSGEVFSRLGPLSEIYDGSPEDENFYALTAFVGLSEMQRQQLGQDALHEACMMQLQRLFGAASSHVKQTMVSDWSREPFTTTQLDLDSMVQHPQYPATMPRHLWNERLLLAGTEVAREQGGYLEGALEAADEATAFIPA